MRTLFATLILSLSLPALAAVPDVRSPANLCGVAGPVDLEAVFARQEYIEVHLVLPLRPARPPTPPSQQQRSRQTVVVDGIVLELPAFVIEGMIRNGTFIPVYAGTDIPISRSEWLFELPCWANPDCP